MVYARNFIACNVAPRGVKKFHISKGKERKKKGAGPVWFRFRRGWGGQRAIIAWRNSRFTPEMVRSLKQWLRVEREDREEKKKKSTLRAGG